MDPKKNGHKNRAVIPVKKAVDPCPDCGNELIHQEGIVVCRSCGYESAPLNTVPVLRRQLLKELPFCYDKITCSHKF